MRKIKFRNFKRLILISLLAVSCVSAPIYKDMNAPVEDRVADLLSLMTLEEKIAMISGDSTGFNTKANSRLGIPSMLPTDGPLGVNFKKGGTSFPAAVALAASWDTLLLHEIGMALASETKAFGRAYLLGPCVGIHRFPFGGRNFESYSEDPYLTSRLAVNWIKGLQGEGVVAAVKHYAVNDQEWERDNYDVIVSERALREIHLPAFEAAVKEANVYSVMTAYNCVNGQHCSENFHLIRDILKGDWGFKGFVVSDWVSTHSTVPVANAGLDLEMPYGRYLNADSLKKPLADKLVSEEIINDKVRRILRVMFTSGIFEEKKVADTSVLYSHAHKQLAYKAACEGVVLLKNQDNILPLNISKLHSLAIIGPNAGVCRTNGGGSSFVHPLYKVSPLEGITKKVGNKLKINFALGDTLKEIAINPIKPEYLKTPDRKEKGLKAEFFNNINLSGSPVVISTINQPLEFFWKSGNTLAKEVNKQVFSVRMTGYLQVNQTKTIKISSISDDGIRLYLDNQLVLDHWSSHDANYDEASFTIQGGKQYKVKIEHYSSYGSAQLHVGWSYDLTNEVNHSIEQAVAIAKKSDAAIVFVGLADFLEHEGVDPGNLFLPGKQLELIKAVADANPNIVVVLNGGIVLETASWIRQVKGVVNMFYLGQETGNAIASILFGEVNPSGKLPVSYLSSAEKSPAWKGYKDKSYKVRYDEGIFVGYRYYDKNNIEPAFPFGFGLSYTTFTYSNMQIKQKGNQLYEVIASISNNGKVKGDEVVQLYVSDPVCSVPRPVRELKGFARISLNPGETKLVSMQLKARDFAFWDDASHGWKVEPGEFIIELSASSRDIRLSQKINI